MISKNEISRLATEKNVKPSVIDKDWVLGHIVDAIYFNDKRTGYAARIKYWGADHRKDQQPPEPARWLTGVKVEVILYEIMVFEAELRDIYHPYSDRLTENALNVPIYNIHEALAEKIRALIQRSYTAPRDYYDIWYMGKYVENIDWKKVVSAFKIKTAYKKLSFTGVGQLINEDNDRVLRAAWKNSLEHQLCDGKLVDYRTVREELLTLFKRIFDE